MRRLSFSLNSRSRKVVNDSSAAADGGKFGVIGGANEILKDNYWENLPAELLREICKRVEETESRWPLRKNVVACAGVCKSWRAAMKEVVLTPEISGRITFPISVKQPGPRNSLLQCFIKRNCSTQTFYLYLNLSLALADDGKFLLAARRFRRPTCTDHIISLHSNDMFKGNSCYVGKLRSNFIGTKFVVYDAMPLRAESKMVRSSSLLLPGSNQISPGVAFGNYPVAHVSYELNVLSTRGPRKMNCVMDSIPVSAIQPGGLAPTQTEFPIYDIDTFKLVPFQAISTHSNKTSRASDTIQGCKPLILRNKVPRWHQQLQCWCLNFHGRVTVASVKNFQLVASPGNCESGPEHEKIVLQFGKVGKDVFTMDYSYPLSAFQAFAICLSSFDTKIACE